jgi:hypothetical protein
MINQRTMGVERLQVTIRPIHFSYQKEDVRDIKRLRNNIHNLAGEFITIRNEIIAELEALPEESSFLLYEIVPHRENS